MEKKFWQRKPIKRYFVLDHKIQKLRVFQRNDPLSEFKIYDYEDILEIVNPEAAENK